MPNRIIKESIRTSRTINKLTDFQFRLWIYLITYADDFGRGEADPELLKGFVFPRRPRVTEKDIEKALADLAGMGCILLYEVDGESYFCFPNWGDHQRVRNRIEKFPAPPTGAELPREESAENNSHQAAASCCELPPISNPIQNPNPESESEINRRAHSRFIPPSLEEVKAYCQERGNNVDPQRFVDYYTANGWLVGKNKMKDWKACVRTWEKNNFNQAQKPVKEKAFNTMQQRTDIDYDDIEARARQQLMGKQ